ncbi:type I DNA topoisomerase [Kangiella koreensis]|uniref:DNA topoisomerase 1 n=1 Tax=Kangiella koreensis (strain DSM 16069 / JCM 12317 / KCTC 12182 / SW-125) TaxID=523791 RepID=C7RA94_KANKD|nr:type I DNA topoisomerase [Kangiella koreensis]ACV26213.1 DNA topoisomerase I [Kangiella koreensis DSM 16069]
MGKSLVIVESPAKAKTINKYLGKDFIVKSSIGHIRDLPTGSQNKKPVDAKERARKAAATRKLSPEQKAKQKALKEKTALFARMGINPEHDWEARYEVLPGKEKVLNELKKFAKDADTIYLATDLDREGEAIAWHLRELLDGKETQFKRVVFNEITKKAIQQAFAKPGDLDMNYVNAQQARRFLDRVVGFMVSPLLWRKISRGLSAGRVQSVAVRLLVEREREIRAFIPEEYWDIHANTLTQSKDDLRLQVNKYQGKNFRPNSEQETNKALEVLKSSSYKVVTREDKPQKSKAPKPFITSTLQQAASTRLGYGVKKTMMMAQRLYEAGYITYMRTDSTYLSTDAVDACRDYIKTNIGAEYLPKEANSYSSKEGAQEAHEAIRPSDVTKKVGHLSGMEKDAERLYDLIWRQFVACQMLPAEFDVTSLKVQAGDYELKARGRVMRFDGWTQVLPMQKKNAEDEELPNVKEGELLELKKLDPKQHFTKPPARFSEAALVKELEKRGIGRPSTYASIISTIQDRGYVRIENRRFYAQKIGEIVTDRLVESFSDLLDFSFTATMEKHLDDIASGRQNWKVTLDEFYDEFSQQLKKADEEEGEGGMRRNEAVETDILCDKCKKNHMAIRNASTGVFLGCMGYSLPPKERCKNTVNLIPGEEFIAADEEEEARYLHDKKRCTKCNSTMDDYLVDENTKLYICGNNPDCDGYEIEKGEFKIKGYDGPILECDKCGSEMQLKTGRFGKYFDCTNDDCKNTRKLLKSGQPAPPKADPIPMPELQCEKVDDHYVLRDGAAGIFLAASKFPRNRETRAPAVDELVTVKDKLDPKYKFLGEAPLKDPDGNRTFVKFSRKTGQQYVAGVKEDGKASGWTAFYENGKWVPQK